jgi:hypothetical protein
MLMVNDLERKHETDNHIIMAKNNDYFLTVI